MAAGGTALGALRCKWLVDIVRFMSFRLQEVALGLEVTHPEHSRFSSVSTRACSLAILTRTRSRFNLVANTVVATH